MTVIDRAALTERWYALTRRVLPAMADRHGWPIRHDHCFMRVCLDEAVDAPWPTVVRRPAVRTMSDDRLAAAVDIAEAIAARPELLLALNARSLFRRRAERDRGSDPRPGSSSKAD